MSDTPAPILSEEEFSRMLSDPLRAYVLVSHDRALRAEVSRLRAMADHDGPELANIMTTVMPYMVEDGSVSHGVEQMAHAMEELRQHNKALQHQIERMRLRESEFL